MLLHVDNFQNTAVGERIDICARREAAKSECISAMHPGCRRALIGALRLSSIVLLAASGLTRVEAVTPSGLPDSLRACTQEQEDSRRLACYDREMERAEKSYGLNDAQRRKLESPKAMATDEKPQTLSSTVLAVTLRSDGRNLITLENGQTWIQGEAFEMIGIHAGDAVTITPGMLGSLYMNLPSTLRTRVTRLK